MPPFRTYHELYNLTRRELECGSQTVRKCPLHARCGARVRSSNCLAERAGLLLRCVPSEDVRREPLHGGPLCLSLD